MSEADTEPDSEPVYTPLPAPSFASPDESSSPTNPVSFGLGAMKMSEGTAPGPSKPLAKGGPVAKRSLFFRSRRPSVDEAESHPTGRVKLTNSPEEGTVQVGGTSTAPDGVRPARAPQLFDLPADGADDKSVEFPTGNSKPWETGRRPSATGNNGGSGVRGGPSARFAPPPEYGATDGITSSATLSSPYHPDPGTVPVAPLPERSGASSFGSTSVGPAAPTGTSGPTLTPMPDGGPSLSTQMKSSVSGSSASTSTPPNSDGLKGDGAKFDSPKPPELKSDGKPDLGMTGTWKNGLWFETKDKAFRFHIGGRTQIDGVWVSAEDRLQYGAGGIGQATDAVGFRRGRLAAEGTLWETIEFNFEYDLVNTFDAQRTGSATPLVANTPVPTDLWVQFNELPFVGNLRIGNQKPPISFEHMTSSRFLNFMERSIGFDAFIESQDNGFRPGIASLNTWAEDDRGVWQWGFYKNNNNIFGYNTGGGEYDSTSRFTILPWASDDNRYFLHLGIATSMRSLDDGAVRYRSRSSIRNGSAVQHNILAEGRLSASRQFLIVPELVMNAGPFTFQAEYYGSYTFDAVETFPVPSGEKLGTVFFQGFYVEGLYFLTGEHRPYDRKLGRFDRVIPKVNAFAKDDCGEHSGHGAWQIGLRFSHLDLRDGGIDGGMVNDITVGLNWFLNPNAKLQWNYVYTDRNYAGTTSDGTMHEAGMRLAVDF